MSTMTLPALTAHGHALDLDEDKLGILRDSSGAAGDFPELRRRFAEDGYLYMKGYLERDAVLAARATLTERLAGLGMIDTGHPVIDAVARPGAENVSHSQELTVGNEPLQRLLYSGRLVDFYRQFYGEEVRHYDFTWLRAIPPGLGTTPHCDLPYMGRGTHRHMTCWIPYGDVSFELGGLIILEGSHKRMDILENYVYRDVDTYCENKANEKEAAREGKWTFRGVLSRNPPQVRSKFGGRWLAAEFSAGDFLTFGMFTVHASLDNRSADRLRISSDTRYQRASDPIDERWIGANPAAHGLAGKRGRVC